MLGLKADEYGQELHNCMICICRVVVTAVLTDADLLGLHIGKSVTFQRFYERGEK